MLRYYRDVDKVITRHSLTNYKTCAFNQSRRFFHVDSTTRIESRLNSSSFNLPKFTGLILRRNFCTKPPKKIDRSWSSLRKQHLESNREIKRLFSLAKNEKWYLIAAVGCLVVSSAVTLGVPRAIGKLMDMIVLDEFPKEKLHALCFALFGIFAIGGLANFGRIYLMNSASKVFSLLN